MVFCLRSGYQTTECRVGGAKLSKTKETAVSEIAIEDDVNCFFDAEHVIHQEFVPEVQKVNAEFYVGVLDRLLKRIRRVIERPNSNPMSGSFFTITRHLITLQLWISFLRTGTLLFSTTHLTRQILHLPTTFSSPS